MRKIFTLAIAVGISLSATYAQKFDKDYTKFRAVQLPLTPLDENLKNYKVIVKQTADQVKAKMEAEYQAEVARVDAENKVLLDQWEKDKAAEQARYDKELEAYNSKSTAGKFFQKALLDEEKPQLKTVPRPYLKTAPEPAYPQVRTESSVAGYINVEGMTKTDANAVVITVNVENFEIDEGTVFQSKRMKTLKGSDGKPLKNADGTDKKVPVYEVKVRYRQQVSIKIETPTGDVILEEVVPNSANYKSVVYPAGESTSEWQARSNWNANKAAKTREYENTAFKYSMQEANNMVNSQIGKPVLNYSTWIAVPRHKKMKYTDYEDAFDIAFSAYTKLASDTKRTKQSPNLLKATAIWEKAADQYDPDGKSSKTRINDKVIVPTYLNLIAAYIWANKYDEADMKMAKLKRMKIKNRYEDKLNALKKLSEDQRKRWEANK